MPVRQRQEIQKMLRRLKGVEPPSHTAAVSEYQYFEFRAIDRPLSADDMASLRSLSSRAEISPRRLAVTYNDVPR